MAANLCILVWVEWICTTYNFPMYHYLPYQFIVSKNGGIAIWMLMQITGIYTCNSIQTYNYIEVVKIYPIESIAKISIPLS